MLPLKNAQGFEVVSNYNEINHHIIIINMIDGYLNLKIICDSTEEIYAEVEKCCWDFIRSITIK
jgi:hypothetical protein